MVCLDVADVLSRRPAQESVTASPDLAHWAAAANLPTCTPPCGGLVLRNTHTPRETIRQLTDILARVCYAYIEDRCASRGRYNLRKEFVVGVIRI